jgi:hypothetical protein
MPLDLPAAFRLNARLGRFLTDRSRGLALWSAWMTAHSAVIVAIEQAITFTTWLFGGMGILRHLFHRTPPISPLSPQRGEVGWQRGMLSMAPMC